MGDLATESADVSQHLLRSKSQCRGLNRQGVQKKSWHGWDRILVIHRARNGAVELEFGEFEDMRAHRRANWIGPIVIGSAGIPMLGPA